MAYRPLLLASAAASALVPQGAFASTSGFSGSPSTPSFACGAGAIGIGWGAAAASQPELAYLNSQGNVVEAFSFDCDQKGNFTQTIARKAGEGQKDFLKITFKEVLITSYQVTGEVDYKITFNKLKSDLFSFKFDVAQGGFLDNKFLPLQLGYKFTFAQPDFVGLPSFKFDFEQRSFSAFIPLQDTDGSLSLFAPGAIPEPETWISMILGLMVTGSALRVQRKRRRRVQSW